MGLKLEIESGIKQAMLAKDQSRLRTLRAVKSAILLEETSSGAKAELNNDDEMKILIKMAKQRRDSIQIYKDQNREDLSAVEEEELKIIEEFLPQQMSEEELTSELKKIIQQVGATDAKDMGKVMGAATKAFAGKADGKLISTIVRTLLA